MLALRSAFPREDFVRAVPARLGQQVGHVSHTWREADRVVFLTHDVGEVLSTDMSPGGCLASFRNCSPSAAAASPAFLGNWLKRRHRPPMPWRGSVSTWLRALSLEHQRDAEARVFGHFLQCVGVGGQLLRGDDITTPAWCKLPSQRLGVAAAVERKMKRVISGLLM